METRTIISHGRRMVLRALDEKARDVLELALDDDEIYRNLDYGVWEVCSEMNTETGEFY